MESTLSKRICSLYIYFSTGSRHLGDGGITGLHFIRDSNQSLAKVNPTLISLYFLLFGIFRIVLQIFGKYERKEKRDSYKQISYNVLIGLVLNFLEKL